MPIYSVQGPDGKVYDVQGPDGATADQLGAFIMQNMPATGGSIKSSAPGIDVTLHYDDAPKQKSDTLGDLGRQLGLTTRAAITGAAGIPDMLWNGPAVAMNSVLGTSIPTVDPSAISDALGLPKPANSMERVAGDVASAMTPVGAMGILGKLGEASGPVVKGITSLLGDNLGAQTTTAALSSGASSSAKESDLGPGAQATAGLLAGLVPTVAAYSIPQAVRNVVTGGDAGRQAMLENMRTFRAAGTTPTIGQATQRRIPRAIESLLSKTPGGAGVMADKATRQADEIQSRVNGITSNLSGNVGPVEAGESLANAMQGFKDGIRNVQNGLYATLDQHIAPNMPISVARTYQALRTLNSSINGAPALSKMFKNARIVGIGKALTSDLQSGGGSLPYQAIKKLRTLVGQEIDNSNFTSDIPRSKWRALYAALSDDLGDAATQAGPDAAQAWQWANGFTRMMNQRLEALSSVAGKDSPEKVFNAAMSGSGEGDTILKRVVSAVPKQNRRDLAATVIARMGRATPGNQNDVGEVFSPNTFLTNWNRMSDAAKHTLFGRVGRPGLLGDLGDLASVASNIRDGSKVFANPSGTSGALAGLGLANSAAVSLMTGHPLIAAAALSPVPVANWLARKMTNPETVQNLAQSRFLPPGFGLGLLAASPGVTSGLLTR